MASILEIVDEQAKKKFPAGWKAPKPYLRVTPRRRTKPHRLTSLTERENRKEQESHGMEKPCVYQNHQIEVLADNTPIILLPE